MEKDEALVKLEKFKEEIEKHLKKESVKKVYSVSLTKENVDFIKKHMDVPFSKLVDEMLGVMVVMVKKMEEEKTKSEGKESDTDKAKE